MKNEAVIIGIYDRLIFICSVCYRLLHFPFEEPG